MRAARLRTVALAVLEDWRGAAARDLPFFAAASFRPALRGLVFTGSTARLESARKHCTA